MQYTEDQKVEFKKQYSDRRRKQIFLTVAIVAVFIILFLSEGNQSVLGIPRGTIAPVALLFVLGGIGFSFYNWRCPACNKYLGKSINPKFCVKCGVALS